MGWLVGSETKCKGGFFFWDAAVTTTTTTITIMIIIDDLYMHVFPLLFGSRMPPENVAVCCVPRGAEYGGGGARRGAGWGGRPARVIE